LLLGYQIDFFDKM